MKIQETNVLDIFENEAVVSLTIAGHKDLEQTNEYVVLQTYVAHEPGLPLETIQLRALERAMHLIEKQSHQLQHRLPQEQQS